MRLTILTTGGTIDKTYDEFQGSLRNQHTVIDVILDGLRTPDLEINHVDVMHKDSIDMTEEDREIMILADRDVPYVVIKKLMRSCMETPYTKVSFAVLKVAEEDSE